MGAMCVEKQSASSRALNNMIQCQGTPYYHVITAYVYHYYGKEITPEIEKWIEEKYNPNYESTVTFTNGRTTTTKKHQVVDRLKTAHEKGLKTYHLSWKGVDKLKRIIRYEWIIQGKENGANTKYYYSIEAQFDQQNRILKATWRQFTPDTPINYSHYQYYNSKPSWASSSYNYNNNSSSNQYLGPPPEKVNYDHMIQKSNQEFRQKMNKQAQEWNDYARQKNNRGW